MDTRTGAGGSEELGRGLRVLLVLATVLTVGLGVTKLLVQRAYPPPHVVGSSNIYEGFVSIDQYCRRAESFRDGMWATGAERAAAHERLQEDLSSGSYPTAVLVPATLGALSRWTGSIPLTFAFLSVGALVLQLFAVLGLGTYLGRACGGSIVGLAAAILLVGHVNAARSAAQLLIDPFAAAFGCACVLVALRRRARASGGSALLLMAIQVLGTFVKLTYLPLLAAPALIELVAGGERRLARTVRAGVLFGLLPALPVLAYLLTVPGWGSFSSEMVRAADSSSLSSWELRNFGLEMVLLFQALPLLWLLGRRAAGAARGELDGVFLVLAVFVVSLLGLRLPDDYRLYLPVLGLLAAAAAPGIVRFPDRLLLAALGSHVVLNAGVAAFGIWSQLPRR